MSRFDGIAETSFWNSPNGERIFRQGGLRLRSYVVPDSLIEQRLLAKNSLMSKWVLGGVWAIGVLVLVPTTQWYREWYWFAALLVATTAYRWLVFQAIFGGELRALRRSDYQPPRSERYGRMAELYSTKFLVFSFFFCLACAAGGAFMAERGSLIFGILCSAGCMLGAAFFGYALYLRWRDR